MRGADDRPSQLFSYVDLEARVPKGHPLRAMRDLVNPALIRLDDRFAALYKDAGCPSIAPERLLRAILLQLFYSIRSERQLMERLNFDLLFRWFVGLGVDDPVWDASTFSKNRTRVLTEEIAQGFLSALLSDRREAALERRAFLGGWHDAEGLCFPFQERWSKDGFGDPPGEGRNGERNFRDEKRSNETRMRPRPTRMLGFTARRPGRRAALPISSR